MSSKPTLKQRIRLVLTWLIGLGLLGWLMHKLDWSVLPQILSRIDAAIWLGAAACIVVSYAFRASRMQLVLVEPHERRGRILPSRAVWRVMLIHNAAINLLPMRGGELSFPWLARRELGQPVSRSVAALMWMRIQDLGVLLLLAALAWPGLSLDVHAALVAVWLLGVVLLQPVAGRVLRLLVPTASVQATGWRKAAGALRAALEEPSHNHPLTWFCTLGNWAVKLAAGSAMLAAVCHVSFGTGWAGAVGGELTAILPIQGPASLGTYEAGVKGGMAWIAGLGAAAPQEAVLGALAWHLMLIAASVIGAALAGFSHLRAAAAGPEDGAGARDPKQGDNSAPV